MNNFWLKIGFLGQFMFTMRFVVQWLVSEKNQKSTIPFAFWIFSILGSLLLLSYAIHKKDPVFILGQSFGIIVYIRNIMLMKKYKNNRK
ncbi:lipid A biosynthesis-like protein [Hypnocyclicus thermotrophus]|uniref:Lipid A biosynthesis-like protein n=1 Tax=Hypnocyclicus thermotrophus TaxID=1627895 RepID=A0AA46DX84_9FUSO|nr:lipid-A-disaccharide synthase N-terminal domain-containing protein [Hypnocyclicus thermotrophus]TDT67887.1 lipid A biosynthesis-like protein [Hypnocyclicus thermotrophus]